MARKVAIAIILFIYLTLGAIIYNLLTPDTLYFNNLVSHKEAMEKEWLQPIKESWLAKKYGLTVS